MAGSKVQNVKLVLLGDQGVGKSSIALRFVRGEFTENSEATIGGTYCSVICLSKLSCTLSNTFAALYGLCCVDSKLKPSKPN